MAKVRFHRAARAELDRAFAWYEERNPEAAARGR
jgi:plasmid stabilization system protein ParE